MFVPVGFLISDLWKWKGLWDAAGLSAFIEILQLLTRRGLCELDDVFHNMIGTAIGIGLATALNKIKDNEEHR